MSTLYELNQNYIIVLEMLSNSDIDDVESYVNDTLESIESEIEEKAENIAYILKELESEIEKFKNEENRLNAKRKTLENNVKALKNNLYNSMKITNKEKFSSGTFKFSIQKNPPKLVVDDISKIPKKYFIKQEPKLDSTMLKNDLKNGNLKKYAHLEQTESVRIK